MALGPGEDHDVMGPTFMGADVRLGPGFNAAQARLVLTCGGAAPPCVR
jgi:hypothetical protein